MELAEQKDQVAPQIVVPDGEVFAVQMGGAYFFDFDEDGFPRTHHFPHCVTKEEAEETRKKLARKYQARVVRIKKGGNKLVFWVYDDDNGYSSRTLSAAGFVRQLRDNAPDWFKASMMKFSPEGSSVADWDDEGWDDGIIALDIFWAHTNGHRWLDHEGFSDNVLVSEPYHLEDEGIKSLVEDCAKFGWKFRITGKSSHYPSETLRIQIEPIEELTYVRPVRVISEGQKAWEDERLSAFDSISREQACLYIEHVLHLVDSNEQAFVQSALKVVRGHVAGEVSQEALTEYHDIVAKKSREHHRQGGGQVTQFILCAVEYALGPIKSSSIVSHIGILCTDAIEYFEHPKRDFPTIMNMVHAEQTWQEERRKEMWAGFEEKFGHGYQEAV